MAVGEYMIPESGKSSCGSRVGVGEEVGGKGVGVRVGEDEGEGVGVLESTGEGVGG